MKIQTGQVLCIMLSIRRGAPRTSAKKKVLVQSAGRKYDREDAKARRKTRRRKTICFLTTGSERARVLPNWIAFAGLLRVFLRVFAPSWSHLFGPEMGDEPFFSGGTQGR